MGFKENLKAELSYKNMLVKELSVKTGISRRTLDNYLRDSPASPTVENAVKIARALDVSVEYLVTGDLGPGRNSKLSSEMKLIQTEMERLGAKEKLIVLDLIASLKKHLQP
ncbi:MAG: helix-turn-helix transcriptional regulator [Treponema sp.]|nr:helix-turn-helix transcriptional regulator [Treponema sp.]